MAEIGWSEKSLEGVKEEEIADTGERKLQQQEESEGFKLLESVAGNGGEQVSVGRQQSDEFGEQELEQVQKVEEEEGEEDEDDEIDGPPPGWGSSLPPLSPAFKVEQEQQWEGGRRDLKLQELVEKQQLDEVEEREEKVKEEDEEQLEEDDDENEGPPPGWGSTLQPAHPPSSNQSFPPFCSPGSHDKVEDDDDDQMEGPPPGWASPSWQLHPSSTPPHDQCLNPPPPPKRAHVFCKSCRRHLSYPQGSMHVRCSTCQTVNQAVEEKAQMVCGFCRRLLSYPQGSRFIQCSLCKQVNYVLQEHEVRQVKCENCSELLMYPNGAPSVRCTKCHFVTDIGEDNRRPLLSVQQGRPSPGTLAH